MLARKPHCAHRRRVAPRGRRSQLLDLLASSLLSAVAVRPCCKVFSFMSHCCLRLQIFWELFEHREAVSSGRRPSQSRGRMSWQCSVCGTFVQTLGHGPRSWFNSFGCQVRYAGFLETSLSIASRLVKGRRTVSRKLNAPGKPLSSVLLRSSTPDGPLPWQRSVSHSRA